MKRAVLYLRVSTQDQTTANQERELREVASRMGCDIVKVYKDHGISGAKGRDKRPAFDAMCKAANRREFDVVMAWSVDRLGRFVALVFSPGVFHLLLEILFRNPLNDFLKFLGVPRYEIEQDNVLVLQPFCFLDRKNQRSLEVYAGLGFVFVSEYDYRKSRRLARLLI